MRNDTVTRDFEGIYEIAEAARYLHATIPPADSHFKVPSRKLIRWIRLGLTDPSLAPVPGRRLLITFEDLVSLRVVAFFRSRGITFPKIRAAESYLRSITGYHRPFATESLWVPSSGSSHVYAELGDILVQASRGGQMAFVELVGNGLINIHGMTFDERRVANSWTPRPHVSLRPEIQFGRPCITGTRIPTDAIAGMVRAGDSIDFLARSYGITAAQIQAAIEWEGNLAAA